MKIGIYGGTFDPIHNGHLRVIVELLTRKVVDKIILIPAGEPRLRSSAPVADAKTRLEMCNLAKADLPTAIKDLVEVSDIEINRAGPSYAIDTVTELMARAGKENQNEFYWIIGSDAYEKIDSWHRADELKDLVSFIVIDRPSTEKIKIEDSNDLENDLENEMENGMDIGALNISATQIRADQSVSGVSPSVRKYIMERKLYASK